MPPTRRSADDLPLAAYSTGVDPETEPNLNPRTVTPTAHAPIVTTARAAGPSAPPFGQAFGDGSAAAQFATTGSGPAATLAGPVQPAFRDILRDPRANLRDPRLLLSGVVVIGVVLLLLSLLGGGGSKGPGVALASPTAPAGPNLTVAPAGDASVELSGAVTATFDLAGVTGTGRPGGATMSSSWGDQLGDILALGGPVSAGTRTTDAGFTLSWTVMVDGKAVTFTSKAGECTIGMAVKPATVSGSFTCHKVRSADGKLVVGATGTYRT